MWDLTKGVREIVIDHRREDEVTTTEHRYMAWTLDGIEVDITSWNGRMPTPDQFMNWAWGVSGLPGRVFQRNAEEPDTESRFDPDRSFTIDRALVSRHITAGDVISFCHAHWDEARPVMVVMITPTAVTVMQERRVLHMPVVARACGRKGVRMLLLEDETCSG